MDFIGDPADTEGVVARLDLGDLGGTAWTIEVDANGALSHGASYYVADGESKLSAVQVSSSGPLSEDYLVRIFSLAVKRESP